MWYANRDYVITNDEARGPNKKKNYVHITLMMVAIRMVQREFRAQTQWREEREEQERNHPGFVSARIQKFVRKRMSRATRTCTQGTLGHNDSIDRETDRQQRDDCIHNERMSRERDNECVVHACTCVFRGRRHSERESAIGRRSSFRHKSLVERSL